ncbi:hypothetical protein SLS55_001835 [Diplodia seriata]|uniref:Uncharacterized protein n=1 Tax=Diplodia seriata TaxID=420778 RepID=A0ABR3CRA8_9PEZI
MPRSPPPPKQPPHLTTNPACPRCGPLPVPTHRYNPARPRLDCALHYDPRRELTQIKYVAQKPYWPSRPRWLYDEESVVVCVVGTTCEVDDDDDDDGDGDGDDEDKENDEKTDQRVRAGYGIYFGRGSRRNVREVLRDGDGPRFLDECAGRRDRKRALKAAAQIAGARRALEVVGEGLLAEEVDRERGEEEIREVIILTKPGYLVDAITERVFVWKDEMAARARSVGMRGGGNFDREPPFFHEILRLYETVEGVERSGKVAVRFWDREEEIPFEAYDLAGELWEQAAE